MRTRLPAENGATTTEQPPDASSSSRVASDLAEPAPRPDWVAVARALGPQLESRAAIHDEDDSFVADNFVSLRKVKVFSAGIPVELGGGGASHAELCALLRELARYCGSTALALSMHTHLVATTVWRYRQGQSVEPLLRRIAAEQIVLVSTGGADWLDSNGTAARVEGGYRITARKIFSSGSPAGDLLITSAQYDDPHDGTVVLHFPVPMRAEGVTVLDNWRTMGMRATGSNDVLLEAVFVPDDAIGLRRPKGQWHPFVGIALTIALPLVMSVYLGVAEAACDLAVRQAHRKRGDSDIWYLTGEMENALVTGQLAVRSLIDLAANYAFAPDVATANAIFIRKTIASQSLLAAAEKALELVGGGGMFRGMGLERLIRDLHGAQFHPLQAKPQHRIAGRFALGLDPFG